MNRLIKRFERYFLERKREEHKESTSTYYCYCFMPFIDPFPNLSLSFLGHIMQEDSSAH